MNSEDYLKQKRFNEWYIEYFDPLCGWLKENVVNSQLDYDDLHDVAQETFVRVWRYMDAFRDDSKPFTWICRVGWSTAVRMLHQKYRQQMGDRFPFSVDELLVFEDEVSDGVYECVTPDFEEEYMSHEDSPEEEAIATQLAERVADVIRTLPPRWQELSVAFYLKGKTYYEIADEFDMSYGAVKTVMAGVRQRLKEATDA